MNEISAVTGSLKVQVRLISAISLAYRQGFCGLDSFVNSGATETGDHARESSAEFATHVSCGLPFQSHWDRGSTKLSMMPQRT